MRSTSAAATSSQARSRRRARGRVAGLEKGVAGLRQAFQLAETRLREGTVDLVTVLQTQQTLFTAEANLVLARFARLQAVLSLFQALGGSWLPPGVGANANVIR